MSTSSRSRPRPPSPPSSRRIRIPYPIRTIQRFCRPAPGADFETPEDYGLLSEAFETDAADGVRLRGWLFEPEDAWGVVVVCHARGASKSRTLRQTALLHASGLAVVAFDFRGCGESGAPAVTVRNSLWSPLRDVDAVVRWVERRFSGPSENPDNGLLSRRIALLGCSFGGNVALAYTGRTNRVFPALILDSTPLTRWQGILRAQLRRERRAARHRRMRAVADHVAVRCIVAWTRSDALYRHARRSARTLVGTDVLYIVGEQDDLFDVDESRRFLEREFPGRTRMWSVPRGRHLTNHVVAAEAYRRGVVEFLAAAFDRADPRYQTSTEARSDVAGA